MREQKRKRDEEKKAKMNYLTGGTNSGDKNVITNAYLDQILNDEDPFAPKVTEASAAAKTRVVGEMEPLLTSTYVIDI